MALLLVTAGCASTALNAPLHHYDPAAGPLRGYPRPPATSPALQIITTFSGGGTRAAALAFGVLEEFRDTTIRWEGRHRRLLDEVDVISAVSGGAFTAAYYGLFGDRLFSEFEARFLKQNIQRSLTVALLSPFNLVRLGSPYFNRSDLAAEYYDAHLFEGGTFRDIAARQGPLILVNATDLSLGAPFRFTQAQFNLLCSDLSSFPVARAVAASAALPIVFSPVTLRNYDGCGYTLPAEAREALEARQVSTRQYRLAARLAAYLDATKRPYIHLVDGGVADNLGLRPILEEPILAGGPFATLERAGLEAPEKVLIVVVSAEPERDPVWDRLPRVPSMAAVLGSVAGAAISHFNFETMDLLRVSLRDWARDLRARSCEGGDRARNDCDGVDIYLVEVNLDAVRDAGERTALKRLPTALHLPAGAVDALRTAARRVLRESPEFQRFLSDVVATGS